VPLHGIAALGGIVRHIEAGGLGGEPGAVLVHQRHIAEQIEQLCLGLVHPGIGW